MNRLAILMTGLGIAAALQVGAQPAAPARPDDSRPPRDENRPEAAAALTPAQTEQVKAILSKYAAETLTADQAKAIHEAFRQAGIRGGPALNAAVRAAGVDPDRLRDLAPPPGQAGGKDQPPSPRDGEPGQGGGERPEPPGQGGPGGGGYLFSQAIAMPTIPDTDFLFAAGAAAKPAAAAGAAAPAAAKTAFALRSPAVADGGQLPPDYTGDGTAATLPLEWSGAPAGTKSYAVIMHHIPGPGDVKWYWILYNLPVETQSLPRNVKGVGTLGNNSVNGQTEYAPPHSKGPGPKTYIYTVHALSAAPQLKVPPAPLSRRDQRERVEGEAPRGRTPR